MEDTLQRIEAVLDLTFPDIPWDFGAKNPLSEKAAAAWESLTVAERLAISRHNPYRTCRKDILFRLHEQGLSYRILSEISGLCLQSVCGACLTKRKEGFREEA